jgi:lipopolysaccharide transport system permease protein
MNPTISDQPHPPIHQEITNPEVNPILVPASKSWFVRQRWRYLFDLVYELVLRDMRVRYKRSILGFAWSLINPLLQLSVVGFVFSKVLPLQIANYPLFLLTGLLAWNWFQTSLLAVTGSIVDNREVIRQPGFPTAMLPVVTVTTNLVHFVLALPILIAMILFSGQGISLVALLLPVVIALQFLLTLSVGFFLATLHVSLRDTQYLVGISLLLGFYLTPVFYDPASIPARYQMLFQLNPMLHIIGAYRSLLLLHQLPPLFPLTMIGLLGGILLWLTHRRFVHASYFFIEEL